MCTNRSTSRRGPAQLGNILQLYKPYWTTISCMTPEGDIHNYGQRYEGTAKKIRQSSISLRNKELILEFDKTCLLESLSIPRRVSVMDKLYMLALIYLKKDFDRATIEDVKRALASIESREDYSVWTKQAYRSVMKKFFKWIKFGDNYRSRKDYPKIVAWINTNLKKKDKPRVQASQLLTEDEVRRLIDAAEYPRDKAFISMLYELGARIGEIGNMNIRDVSKDKYSYLVDLNGKTGRRTPRIVMSSPQITNWMNIHPDKNNPSAPLWVLVGHRDKARKMRYGALRALVKRLVSKAGINKRIYPHLFRHTRVTHLLKHRQISEAQAKVYFGWAPSSRELDEYSHLVSSDVNDAILEIHGIKRSEERISKLHPKQCQVCSTINLPDALFCQKCSQILDLSTAIQLDEQRSAGDDVIAEILKHPKVQEAFKEKSRDSNFRKKMLEFLNQERSKAL